MGGGTRILCGASRITLLRLTSEMKAANNTKNTVALADILEYEILDELEKIVADLKKLNASKENLVQMSESTPLYDFQLNTEEEIKQVETLIDDVTDYKNNIHNLASKLRMNDLQNIKQVENFSHDVDYIES
jgi:hypothetical protein